MPSPWLLAVLALAASLRFWGLGHQSIWWDEAYSLDWANRSPAGTIAVLQNDVHPPLYYLVLGFWMKGVGPGVEGARFLSALIGLAGVGAAYLLGRDMFRRTVGALFALFVAVSEFHIYHSQEIRSYGMLFLTAVLSMHAYWNLWNGKGDRRWRLAYYIIASTALLYTHFTGIFVVAAQFAHRGISLAMKPDRAGLRQWLVSQAVVALAFLPWALVLLRQAGRVESGFWIPSPTLDMAGGPDFSVTGTFYQFTGSPFRAWIMWLFVLNGVAAVSLAGLNRSKNPDDSESYDPYPARKILLLVAWLAASILLPYFQSVFSQPVYLSRAMSPALAPFLLLVAVGIGRLRNPVVLGFAALLVVGLAGPGLGEYYNTEFKEPWKEAVASIDAGAAPNATVVLLAWNEVPFAAYDARPDLHLVVVGPSGNAPAETLNRTVNSTDIWLLGSPNHGDPAAVAAAVSGSHGPGMPQTFAAEGLAPFPAAANPVQVYHWTRPAP
ncbi:MAG: glycosyltransferase family 39 protein [Thermoplasmatota archaeon]